MVEEYLRAHLSAASLGGPAIFCGPVRPGDPPAIPFRSIFLCESSGLPPSPYMDSLGTSWRYFRVQARVRGEPNAYASGRDLAQAVWSAIHTSSVTGGFVRVTCEQSSPLYIGKDATSCYEWSTTVVLEKRG